MTREPKAAAGRTDLPPDFKRAGTVYALTVALDIEQLRARHGDRSDTARREVRRVLRRHGFRRQRGDLYLGGPRVTAVTVVLAVQDLTRVLPWFAACVRDIRMLRIEESNDLLPVVRRLTAP